MKCLTSLTASPAGCRLRLLSRGCSRGLQHHGEAAGGVALVAGDLHQEAAQLQLLAVAVLQLDTPVARQEAWRAR